MINNNLEELAELRENHRKRLVVLEQTAALYGIDVEPHIKIEIEDIKQKIADIDKEANHILLSSVSWTDDFVDTSSDITNPKVLSDRITALGRYLAYREDSIRREVTGIYRFIVDNKEKDDNNRLFRQRRTDHLYILIILLLVVIIVLQAKGG